MNKNQTCYGEELILDLHNCDNSKFTRKSIRGFLIELCQLIDMERETLHFWDYKGDEEGYKAAPDHLKGISAVQFIKTSNITMHTLDVLDKLYLNIFSCKSFNPRNVTIFAETWFGGKAVNRTFVKRV